MTALPICAGVIAALLLPAGDLLFVAALALSAIIATKGGSEGET